MRAVFALLSALVAESRYPGTKIKELIPLRGLRVFHNKNIPKNPDHGNHQPFPDVVHLGFDMDGKSVELMELEIVKDLYTPNSTYEIHMNNGYVLHKKHVMNAYRKNTTVVVMHESGTFDASFMYEGELHYAQPISKHKDSMHETYFKELSEQAVHDMVVFKAGHIDLDAKGGSTLAQRVEREIVEFENRRLLAGETGVGSVTQWNCYSGAVKKIRVNFISDYGFTQKHGGETGARDEITSIILKSNTYIYERQVNFGWRINEVIIKLTTSQANGEAWNGASEGNCGFSIENQLDYFTQWRQTQTDIGLWHLMTNCFPPPGTVGLAYKGVLCETYNTGVSSRTSETWTVVAHEIGHNYGGDHSFEEGQGNTGGIMDYGDGRLDGFYQFNSQYREAKICQNVLGAVNLGQDWCTISGDPICGDGVVEGSETCEGTTFCTNCQLQEGCECNSGECCDSNCKFKPGSVGCTITGEPGFCSMGVCLPTDCDRYTSTSTGGRYSFDVSCTINGVDECVMICRSPSGSCQNFGANLGYKPDGTGCDSGSGKCQNGVCVDAGLPPIPGWVYSAWSPCSKTCGYGTRTRTAECKAGDQTSTECSDTDKVVTEQCLLGSCYEWRASGTSECSQPCDGGVLVGATYTCHDTTLDKTVDDILCSNDFTNEWSRYSGYQYTGNSYNSMFYGTASLTYVQSECASRGHDIMHYKSTTREFSCYQHYETNPLSQLTASSGWDFYQLAVIINDKPSSGTVPCETQPCARYWEVQGWSSCSKQCGTGQQTRSVVCKKDAGGLVSTVADSECTEEKPETSRTCNTEPCPAYYYSPGQWTTCSATCGGGTQTRTIVCRDQANGNVIVAIELCANAGEQPPATQACNTVSCASYAWEITTDWTPVCPTQCGSPGVLQTRQVSCVTQGVNQVVDDGLCTDTKPATTQNCPETDACPVWVVSQAGDCSATTCNEVGVKTKTVTCVSQTSPPQTVDDSACDQATKPQNVNEDCVGTCTDADFTWTVSTWSACSAGCGGGTMTRSVTCVDPQGTQAEARCKNTQPSTSAACNVFSCPAWVTSPWSICSAPCGQGNQTRVVTCEDHNGFVVDRSRCGSSFPSTFQSCDSGPCPHWHRSEWGACNKECNGGIQFRNVTCRLPHDLPQLLEAGMLLAPTDPRCATTIIGDKPTTSQTCNIEPCPEYFWNPTSWSVCSEPCGTGVQTANAICFSTADYTEAAAEKCGGTGALERPCNTIGCPTYLWYSGSWSQCSTECGGGTRTRRVECRARYVTGGKLVHDLALNPSMCTEEKPPSSESCNSEANICGSAGMCNGGKCECAPGTESIAGPCDSPASLFDVAIDGALVNTPPGNVLTITWKTTGAIDSVTLFIQKAGENRVWVDHISNSWIYTWNVPTEGLSAGEYSFTVFYNDAISAEASQTFTLADPCDYIDCGVGTCSRGVCTCPQGFSGRTCNVDPCAEKQCNSWEDIDGPFTTCSLTNGVATCDCVGVWTGELCRTPSTCPTSSMPACQNGGVPDPWRNREETTDCPTTCLCDAAFTGALCESCAVQCQNNGVMSAGCGGCECPAGYSGSHCHCPYAKVMGKVTIPSDTVQELLQQVYDTLVGDISAALGYGPEDGRVLFESLSSTGDFVVWVRDECLDFGQRFEVGNDHVKLGMVVENPVMELVGILQKQVSDPSSILRRGVLTESLVLSSFSFTPPPGYVDLCAGRTCNGHGTCDSKTGACVCDPAWLGLNCGSYDLCFGNDCNLRGTCDPGTGVCTCSGGWAGTTCSIPPNDCAGQDCNGRGTCTGGFCLCEGGWTGATCENAPDLCLGRDCNNKGSCFQGVCTCVEPYEGPDCATMKDPCAGIDCGVHSAPCAGGTCSCTDDYTGPRCTQPPPTCDDGRKNGAETGIDCGGDCAACPTCTDGIKNGNEVGIDCGGLGCEPCEFCVLQPNQGTCTDGIRNGQETSVDCGGPDCPECARWEPGEWSACTADCGGGIQTRTVTCKYNGIVVDEGRCSCLHAIALQQTCAEQDCEVWEYAYGEWEECNVNCGGGIQTRPVTCQSNLVASYPVDICIAKIGNPLPSTRLCNADPCQNTYNFIRGLWQECSVGCGGGTQKREVNCIDNNQVTVDLALCGTDVPETERSCNTEACVSVKWVACDWDECTATCGGGANGGDGGGSMMGVQSRDIFCMTDEVIPRVVDDQRCANLMKPTSTVLGCNEQPCTDWNWMTTKWTKCADGKRTRTYHCHAPDGSNALLADCEENIPELTPIAEEACILGTCPVNLETATTTKFETVASVAIGVAPSLVSTLLLAVGLIR